MKLWFPLILLFLLESSFAGNIVVLTSLPDKDARVERKIESIVNSRMPIPAQQKLVYVNKADLETLYFHLNSPETFALFWVGHGAYSKTPGGKGMGFSPVLLDHKKVNIAKAFKRVHPNIKFLGVIGCNSSQILNMDVKHNSQIGLYLPKKRVVATWGMKRAIKHFKRHLKRSYVFTFKRDIEGKGLRVRITRIASKHPSPLLVFAGDTLLGLLSEPSSGEEQTQDFFIPANQIDLKILIYSGQDPFNSNDHFGKVTVEGNGQKWDLFARPDGKPFGTNERIFMFWGDRADLGPAESYFIYRNND